MAALTARASRVPGHLSFALGARASPRRLGICLFLLLAAIAAALAAPPTARIPFVLRVDGPRATLSIDGQQLVARWPPGVTRIQVDRAAPAARLFRDDGTDSSGTLSAPPIGPDAAPASPYERFLCLPRQCATYSQWRDLALRDDRTGRQLLGGDATALARIALPVRFTLTGALQRPDIAASITFTGKDEISLTIDPDHRSVRLGDQAVYFPHDWRPFLAEVAWTLSHAYLWALLLLLLIITVALASLPIAPYLLRFIAAIRGRWLPPAHERATAVAPDAPMRPQSQARRPRFQAGTTAVSGRDRSRRPGAPMFTQAALPAALIGAILIALLCISAFSYERLPRILDGVSYYFQAAILRTGNLWAPVPRTPDFFPGPFMVSLHGHWFSHYPPGTPLAIALGMLIGLPWIVEPVMGAGAALLIWRLARRWYGPPTALLALVLLALSPFFLFLAASYLSHMVALFALLLFLEGIDRLAATADWRWAAACGLGAGYALLTRELDAVLFALPVLAFYGLTGGSQRTRGVAVDGNGVARALLAFVLPLLLCLLLYLFYDWRLTGDPWLTPRAALDASDAWGFGAGKGWYGQHTPAAGLFVMENQLTSLLIHLYGWPYYLTLSFFLLPLATLRLRPHDLLLYTIAGIFLLGYAAYFYHGIAFGPRYLFASLPTYILLTARGMVEAAALAGRFASLPTHIAIRRLSAGSNARSTSTVTARTTPDARQGRSGAALDPFPDRARAAGIAAVALVALALCACNLAYYLPRQIGLYHDYLEQRVDGSLTYDRLHPPWLHHALVLSDDRDFYADVLFPLNDPQLKGDVLYALDRGTSLGRLRAAFPLRTIYRLRIVDRQLRFLPVRDPPRLAGGV